jgi:perosamine synthetase
MFKHNRDIAAGHFTSTADSPRFAEFYRDCPNSRKVEQELIYLPTYPSYSRSEVEKNIQVIRKYFASRVQQVTKQKVSISN